MKKICIFIFSLFSFMLLNAQTTRTVGGTGADYVTLKLAFDAINSGSLSGTIILMINGNTTETSTAYLNASGTGSANFTSLKIYPTASGLSVSGNFEDATIELRGADNVTIDGRVDLGGSTASLTISNSNTHKYAAAIKFITSAENNLVRYCNLQSSCASIGRGMIMFASSNDGNGNDNNTIEYCNITNAGNRPIEAIFSSGSSGRSNSGNIIQYNNIYNFFNPNSTSYGIHLSYETTDWTITGNSFYETTTFSPVGAYKYYPIHVNTGDNHIVSDNYIGGSGPQCSGTFTIDAMVPYYFCAIFMNGGTAGNIHNNEISNLNCTCSEDNPWDGIYINSGYVDVTDNTIGSGTGNNSIIVSTPLAVATATITGGEVTGLTLLYGGSGYTTTPTVTFSSAGSTAPATATATMSGGVITGLNLLSGGAGYTSTPRVIFDEQSNNYSTTHAIIQSSSDIVNITGNTIGSITTVGSDYYTHGFETVYIRGASSTTTLSNNLIGSLTTANSIHVSSAATNSLLKQDLFGIYSASNGTTVISGNIIANLTNAYAGINAGSRCRGIQATSGQNAILNNTVRDMKVSSGQSSSGAGSSLIGISQTSSSSGQTLSGNQVYNLSNLNAGDVKVDLYGIFFSGPTSGTNSIDGNFVHSISIVSANYLSAMMGIRLYGGYSTLSNNIINIGNSSTLGYRTIGLWDEIGLCECYYNTVYIGGSVLTASTGKTDNTFGLWNNSDNNPRNYRNNILVNARSGGTSGHHYAIRIAGLTSVTIDYNDYYVSGTGGILGQVSWQNKNDLAEWKLATSQDGNSLSIAPGFTSAGGTNSSDYVTSATLPAVFGTGITTDYDGAARANPPKMGALEASLVYVWYGSTDTNFGTASNWGINAVPPNGADISFAASPANDCYLDQNRTLKNITNTSTKKLVINGNQFTLTGSLISATANQIDATTASSVFTFAGTAAQVIPSGVFVSNTIDAITLDNSTGLTQNGDISVQASITFSNGDYSIGANTLTINGSLDITSGTLTGGNSSDIVIGGIGASTTLPGISLNNLTVNRANGISMGGDFNIEGTLTLTSGTLSLGANTLTISGSSPARTSGNIDASNASATLVFTNSSAITLVASLFTGNINNLTINGEGLTASSDLTINGILQLESANPSATKGSLDMSTYTLNMESASTTTGVGDVTGIVKREQTFGTNTEYTFGSQYTTFTFVDANTKPTWISVEISIGTVAGWTPWTPSPDGKIKRLYKLSCSDNSSTAQTNINMRYLLPEMDATFDDESKLVFWHKFSDYASGEPHEHGKSNQDFINHFIGVTGLTFGAAVTSNLDDSQVTMAYSVNDKNTWLGIAGGYETKWENSNNWTAGHVPLSTEDVLIPGGLTYYPSLTSSANAVAKSIEIETGASIAANSYNITVSGAGGAWINQGTFNPGTGKVLFDHGVSDDIVTIAGTTNFYDIEVGANTTFQPAHGSILRIAHTGSAEISSLVDFSAIDNTVEWNGADQDIVNPTGIGGNSGYYNLILSGSGIKTFSGTPMIISGNFNTTGTTTVTVAASVDVTGNLSIDADATINAGAYTYNIGGNITNNGTFNASAGNTIVTNGTSLQSIDGASTAEFYNLTIDNDAGVFFYKDVNVNQTLTLTNGNMIIGGNTLGIKGTINRSSGYIETSTNSSLSFGGSDLITLPDNLFTAAPTINNLIINRSGESGSVALGNQDITINGSLSLTDGDLDLVDNSLILAGTSPTRTSGSINATDPASCIIFSNYDNAIILPDALFTGNISNLTINGLAGVTSLGDLTVDGALSLSATNPSTTAGSLDMKDGSVMKTLTMEGTATTSGVGDVTGIIKREHTFSPGTEYTFGNQFTTINFNEGGTTYPTALEVEVTIGGAPTWKPTAIERIYDFVQTGGSGCYANVATHYLETELNNNNENTLVQLTYSVPTTTLYEWGRSDASTIEKWVKISNVDIANFPTSEGNLKNTLSASEVTTYIWDGSESSDWATLENWTPVGSPSDFSNVIIPDETNDPEIGFTGIASCNDLTLIGNATLTVKSDATGTGSLIAKGTATGDVTFERFLTHNKWHYISGQTNISGDFDEQGMGLIGGAFKDQFYRWEESLETSGKPGTWVDILNGNGSGTLMDNEGFVSCKGYAINYITTDKTLSLSGVPYTTGQSIAITKTINSTNEGANLIGNPFTATIALNNGADATNNFLLDNSSLFDDTYGGVYLWDEEAGYEGDRDDYYTVSNASGSEFAAPGQGFMIVKKDVGTSTVNFYADIRKHGTAPFYKNSNDDGTPRLKLLVKDAENRANTTTIAFLPNMTLGQDPSYDAGKLKGNPNISLYTRLVEDNGLDFAIQALPDNDIESIIVPVGIDVVEGILCEFNVNIQRMEDYPIYLQDTRENSVTNLKEHTYTTFVSESGTGRFFLHFKAVNGIGENSKNNLRVWSSNKVIHIYNDDKQIGDIMIINMYGQSVHISALNGNTNQQIDLNVPAGYFIVSIVTKDGVLNKKVYL
jgi:hypothetical protein